MVLGFAHQVVQHARLRLELAVDLAPEAAQPLHVLPQLVQLLVLLPDQATTTTSLRRTAVQLLVLVVPSARQCSLYAGTCLGSLSSPAQIHQWHRIRPWATS